MIRFLTILFAAICLAGNSYAQNFSVQKIIQITSTDEGTFTHPKMSADGSKIFFSGANFKGLYLHNLSTQKLTMLTDKPGAGYQFCIAPGGDKVYYRTHEYVGTKRYYSLIGQDINDGVKQIIEQRKRILSTPRISNSGNLTYVVDARLETKEINESPDNTLFAAKQERSVYIRNRMIALYVDDQEKLLQPLGQGIYLWPSLSPDGSKLLFTKAGDGTYVSDLEGNIIAEIGYANAPGWSPDGDWIVYMKDEDDGHVFTASDIFVSSLDGTEKFQITDTPEQIELYPDWGKDISQIVYETMDGVIYLAELSTD